jgi:hypothetical protein
MEVTKAKSAGKTNKVPGSLVKCEVNIESGEWLSPPSCATFRMDEEAKFPEIIYEIKTDEEGPYEWQWYITSTSKRWKADLNGKNIGGILTVKVKVGKTTFVRQTLIKGDEPGREKIIAELSRYIPTFPDETRLATKIFNQETGFRHFFSDGDPLVSFDNGYGLGQATNPVPTFEQVWSWKAHVKYIVELVVNEKRALAKEYLDKHGNYNNEDLDMETLVYYNGANYHYLVWNGGGKKWVVNDRILCDPEQSNAGWNMEKAENKGKTLQQLRSKEGAAPKYTGRCYAEHIKNHQ